MEPRKLIPMRPLIRKASKNRAVALVIVLVMLVLMAVLIVAFYSSVKTELVSATSYASGADARNLGDSAVQIAQAQIAAATKSVDAGNKPLLWASQPGMIRTWTSDATGSAGSFYKLYSSSSLIAAGVGFKMSDDALPGNWATQTARYVDLNAPVLVPDGNGTITANGNTFSARYPIMDPALAGPKNGAGDVEGFEIDGAPGYAAGTYPPDPTYNPAKDPNPAAMPVEWLYQLADGTITTPTFDPGTPGKISGFVPAPTQSNPITARLAFWTDDETAKINVNTASEGTFWDMPRAQPVDEMALARNIPVQSEFQRVSGHPSGVSLSPVLNKLLPRTNASALNNPLWTLADSSSTNTGYDEITPYYDLSPRLNFKDSLNTDNTSRAGIRRTVKSPEGSGQGKPIALDAARLYATVDEFLFSDKYTSGSRTINGFGATATPQTAAKNVARYRFLLTANGRADETTPFNTPKVAVWPPQIIKPGESGTEWRNAKERLIVKAATIGGNPYFFQRKNNMKETLAPEQLSSASKSMDYSDIQRNQQLYGYLQKLTGSLGAIPGFGGNFADTTKWRPLGRDRVLTQIFDVIRAQVGILNILTTHLPTDNPKGNPQFAFDTPAGTPAATFDKLGRKFIIPIEISAGNGVTRGFGRYITMSEAVIMFRTYTKTVQDPAFPADPSKTITKQILRAVVYLQPFSPSPQPSVSFGVRIRVIGLDKIKVINSNGEEKALGFPNDVIFRSAPGAGTGGALSTSQSFRPFTAFCYNDGGPKKFGKPDPSNPTFVYNEATYYPLISDEIDITSPTPPSPPPASSVPWGTFSLKGPENPTDFIEVRFLNPVNLVASDDSNPDDPNLLQTLKFQFPQTGKLQLQAQETAGVFKFLNGTVITTGTAGSTADSVGGGATTSRVTYDITRSVVFRGDNALHRGDFRLLSLTKNVPNTWFLPHPSYDVEMIDPAPLVAASERADNPTRTPLFTQGRYAHSLRSETAGNSRYAVGGQTFAENYGGGVGRSKLLPANTVGVDDRASTTGNIAKIGGLDPGIRLTQQSQAIAPVGMAAAYGPGNIIGDWASSYGICPDGAILTPIDMSTSQNFNFGGYWGGDTGNVDDGSIYEPTRQIPSAVAFGDLLTPDNAGNLQGWQSLLFNPVPAGDLTHFSGNFSSNAHYGAKTPPDHLMLEFFWMPVVEPYALSESFSTAGKVNPNYQIAPFNYIHRSTALRGALKSIKMGAIPDAFTNPNESVAQVNAIDYKQSAQKNTLPVVVGPTHTRFDLNLARNNGTIKIYDDFFGNGNNALRTASEVCTLPLVPAGETSATVSTFWGKNRLTSDTLRESPYKQLYSRLTTKSNTYTVHHRVQALTQTPKSVAAGTWDEGKDIVRAEYRGASTIERYIDPNTPGLPDYATEASPAPLGNFARFRTISNRQFTP